MSVELLDEQKHLFVDQLAKYERLTEVALSANAWITAHGPNGYSELINDSGLHNWTSDQTIISTYFHTKTAVKFDLFIKCLVLPNGESKLQFTLDNTIKIIDVKGTEYQSFKVGEFPVSSPGYHKIDLKGIHKSGNYFGDVSHLIFGETTSQQSIDWIHDKTNQTYWSRRGPSVHLGYKESNNEKHEYYYNEVNVPKGFDPIGSYFMVIGFNFGYFGIQVINGTERWIIFSVWSPQNTADPKNVTEDNKVILISKGKDVIMGDFGNEGTGEKAILKYNWTTEITYRFLIRGRPVPNDSTRSIYTAWFAEKGSDWKLIASFKRPKSGQYLSGFYSFVECFDPDHSCFTRKARYSNQWICDTLGNWREVTSAQFTGDETAQKKYRYDFEGGVEIEDSKNHQHFYLKNCGFFEGNTKLLTQLFRSENKVQPKIDINKLPY